MEGSPFSVPLRSELLAEFTVANRMAWVWIPIQLLCLAGLSLLIDWDDAIEDPLLPTIAIIYMLGPFTE